MLTELVKDMEDDPHPTQRKRLLDRTHTQCSIDSAKTSALLTLTGRLYDAALDPSQWCGLAHDIAALFDASSAVLHLRNTDDDARLLYATPNLFPESRELQEQAAYWRKTDLFVRRAREFGSGQVLVNDDMFAPGELDRSDFYHDWCRHLHIFHIAGAMIPLPGGQCATVAVHRDRGARPFGARERHLLEQLLPHYVRALNIRFRLQLAAIEREASVQAMMQSHIAALVLGPGAHMLYANRGAEALLREADGVRLCGGRLVASTRPLSEQLCRYADEAAWLAGAHDCARMQKSQPKPAAVLHIARPGRMPLSLMITPMRLQDPDLSTAAALVMIRDPEIATPDRALLSELFGLTGTEAAIATKLALGESVENIAKARHCSLNTVRTHVANILVKTNTTRQAEAVALMLRSVAIYRSNRI